MLSWMLLWKGLVDAFVVDEFVITLVNAFAGASVASSVNAFVHAFC